MPRVPQLVIDLDMDVFVRPAVDFVSDSSSRPSNKDHEVDSIEFIAERLGKVGLSPKSRVPGAIFDRHEESYFWWRRLLSEGRLRAPFTVVHIDAHSDMGYPSTAAPLFERWAHEPDFLAKDPPVSSANYLAYAVNNGWLNALINVRRNYSPDDVHSFLFKDFDILSRVLQVKKFEAGEAARTGPPYYRGARYDAGVEAQYCRLLLEELEDFNRVPDFAFIARSPAFTPPAIDSYEGFFQGLIRSIA